jgi:SAM-dependent methyltransferase
MRDMFTTAVGSAIVDALFRAFGPVTTDFEDNDPIRTAQLSKLLSPSIYSLLSGTRVVDFGSGRGADAVSAALNGADVIGIEIRPQYIETSRALAEHHGVTAHCQFIAPESEPRRYRALYGTCDVVVAIDSFEHFDSPDLVLSEMYRLLKPGGTVFISFGPPWLHPYGAHMTHFSRFPWIHLVFTERAVLSSASRRGIDRNARSYNETIAEPNRMTIARFKHAIDATPFERVYLRCIPIRRLSWLAAVPSLREFVTSVVKCELRKPRT